MRLSFRGSKAQAPEELLLLRRRFGGALGTLSIAGGTENLPVLKLGENVFVSSEDPSAAMKTVAALNRGDIHPVKSSADATFFAERYKAFRSTDG